jgi:hypothetical protein
MENNQILKELNACAALCNICYNACLNENDITLMARCIELNRECAEICQLSASVLARESENTDKFLMLCSEICESCAEECEKHAHEHCKKCAQVCRKCAEMCLTSQLTK